MRMIHHQQQAYPESIHEQESIVADILNGKAPNTLILTEHPPTYTLGTSAQESDVLTRKINGESIAVYNTGRGGEVTYHGPGQLICYALLNIQHEKDLHLHVQKLEQLIIDTLQDFNIQGIRDSRGIGVWVDGLKIAAVGVRCRKWVTFHGVSLNISPNLKHFSGIVPCGMRDAPVTSMHQLGIGATRQEVEEHILQHATSLLIPSRKL
ncbi:MAG: lipoyl(octanoyl) transferase LipB [Mariprofundaceae bacterium]|nr:lipoyl(octanoyl) transferase LipB [Mariprofundaceae bacterium]